MKVYRISDSELGRSVGVLLYYERTKVFIVELEETLDEWTGPLLFTSFIKKRQFTIPRDISYLWVKERVIPNDRQNISSILANHKMEAYDEMRLMELSRGKCSQDSLFIEKISGLPEYVQERQKKNLKECFVSENRSIICFFKDETVKRVYPETLSNLYGLDKVLSNEKVLFSGRVGEGGYYMTFNDSFDIPASRLYEGGQVIPVSLSDFVSFVKRNTYDTTKSSSELNCSRQNISYLVNKGEIKPIKEEVKGNLYLKGEIISAKW